MRHVVFVLEVGDAVAALERIGRRRDVYELSVDGIPQSRISLVEPRTLAFEYTQWIGRILDAAAPASDPLTVVHLGAGALTLPRYVAATRPGSPQFVVEREQELLEGVLNALPLPDGADVTIAYGDARAVAAEAATQGWPEAADAAIVDLWSGALIGARVASREFYALVAERLAPGGLLVVNLLDGPGFEYTRSQAATLASLLPSVAALIEPRMASNTELGNVVLVASARPLDAVLEGLKSPGGAREAGPHIVEGEALRTWIGDAAPVDDSTAIDSPPMEDEHFARHFGRPLPGL